jgi:hypothetical protein
MVALSVVVFLVKDGQDPQVLLLPRQTILAVAVE